MRVPSGDAATAWTCPLSDGAKDVISCPLDKLYANRLFLVVVFTPGAAPAGRALLKLPPAYTVFPMIACDQTTPLI
jgi:hypothetical protein